MSKFDWLLYRILNKIDDKTRGAGKMSYSQCGEDLIVRFIFDALKIHSPTYIDIGAHHPTYLNNTFSFYAQGARGVNVEPDPKLIREFHEKRPRDSNLNIGVGDKDGSMPFYVMSSRTLNTFSEAEARAMEKEGKVAIEEVVSIPVRSIDSVLDEYFPVAPDLVSIDIEGFDLIVLRSLDFARHRPKVICAETLSYSSKREGGKIPEIAELMQDNGYFAYADTHINTIFLDKNLW